jgi:hypothetical protein
MGKSSYYASGKVITLLALGALFLPACNLPVGELFSPYKCAHAPSTGADIVGTWVPDKATAADMGARGKYDTSVPTELIFRGDGSFEMVNMPDWMWEPGGQSYAGFRSASGAWRLSGDGGCGAIELRYGGAYSRLDLLRRNLAREPTYLIGITLGDPDSGDKMVFVKKA